MTRIISLLACAFMLAVIVASAEPAPNAPVCAVEVDIVYHSYTGPQYIQGVCLSEPAVYANGILVLDIIDNGDSVFSNGFDPE
jgi:hypothetical protein